MSQSYLPLNDPLYGYLLNQRSDARDPVLEALRSENQSVQANGNLSVSPDQASLLNLLVSLIGAKWAVEIGTFTGMSSISIARALSPGGRLICFDQDFKWTSIARRYWFKAGVQDKIELKLGNARELLSRFRPHAALDFVFIDADRESYDAYYEALLPLVRAGGLIVLDNMLCGGAVLDPIERNQPGTRNIDQLNAKLAVDPRVHTVQLAIGDGLTLCRKR